MSEDIRKMIDKVKNFNKFINENNETIQYINIDDIKTEEEMIPNEYTDKERIYLSQNGTDGFGHVMNIHLKNGGKKIGSIVFRQKTYLKDYGYPLVSEFHIGLNKKYQRQGFFQESLIRLLEATDTPIYIASGRVINPDVFKAIDKIDRSLLNVEEIKIEVSIGTIEGFIITLK